MLPETFYTSVARGNVGGVRGILFVLQFHQKSNENTNMSSLQIEVNKALLLVCRGGHRADEMVKLFLEYGADPNSKDLKSGNSALMIACANLDGGRRAQQEYIVRSLVKAGANIDAQNRKGENIFFGLGVRQVLDLLENSDMRGINSGVAAVLSEVGQPFDFLCNIPLYRHGRTVLHKVCGENGANDSDLWQALPKLLLKHGANPNIPDSRGITPLLRCCAEAKIQAGYRYELSREGNSNVFAMPNMVREDRLPTHALRAIRQLLDAGADLHAVCDRQRNALQMAVWNGVTELVELLLERGICAGDYRPWAQQALVQAKNHVGIARLLLRQGGARVLDDALGQQALLTAARRSNLDMTRLLVEAMVGDGATRFREQEVEDMKTNKGQRESSGPEDGCYDFLFGGFED